MQSDMSKFSQVIEFELPWLIEEAGEHSIDGGGLVRRWHAGLRCGSSNAKDLERLRILHNIVERTRCSNQPNARSHNCNNPAEPPVMGEERSGTLDSEPQQAWDDKGSRRRSKCANEAHQIVEERDQAGDKAGGAYINDPDDLPPYSRS